VAGWILAVDFGTVNTGAAIRFPDGRVEKVKLDPNSDTMPSAVVVTDGKWRVGQAALNARRTHPDTFIGSPKARLGQEPLVLGDDLVSPAQIASHVLNAVHERAVRAAGGTEPDRLVLTHPVRWGRARLSALQEAATIAGFSSDKIRLLPEPIAALHAHVSPGSLPPGSRVAVVDTGGGTCDVAVLQTTDDPAPGKDLLVVSQEGDDRLGGNDLDDLLYQWVLTQLRTSGRQDMVTALASPEHLGAALTLLDVVRAAKQDLSEHTNAPIGVTVGGQETTLTVTREEYEELIAEPMTRAGALTARALQASGTTNLAGLYLTGGTAYTPALAQALHKVTDILTAPLGDPKLAVAVGALKTPVAVMTPAELSALAQQLAQQRQQSARPAPAPTPVPTPPPAMAPQAPSHGQPYPAGPPRQMASGPPRVTPPPSGPSGPSHPPSGPSGPPGGPPGGRPGGPPPGPPSGGYPSTGSSYPPAGSSYPPTSPGYPPTQASPPPTHTPPPPPSPTASYGQAGGYRPGQPPTTYMGPTTPRPKSSSKTPIVVGAGIGAVVLVVAVFCVWYFGLRDSGTTAACWDGKSSEQECPDFSGKTAALHAFKAKDSLSPNDCDRVSGYIPEGYVDAFECRTNSGSVYITRWPSPQTAADAFRNSTDNGISFTDAGTWSTADNDEMGTQWVLNLADAYNSDTTKLPGAYLLVYCYSDVPFCIEGSGPRDGANAVTSNFRTMTKPEVQALKRYLDK